MPKYNPNAQHHRINDEGAFGDMALKKRMRELSLSTLSSQGVKICMADDAHVVVVLVDSDHEYMQTPGHCQVFRFMPPSYHRKSMFPLAGCVRTNVGVVSRHAYCGHIIFFSRCNARACLLVKLK